MNVIEAKHYDDARRAFADDPIVQAMFAELPTEMVAQLRDGTLQERSSMMNAANGEYRRRGGQAAAHLGAVLEALELLARR